MNDVEKQRQRVQQELLLIQKYFFWEEWESIRAEISHNLEICEEYLVVDNHLVPELTESYNSIVQHMNDIMQLYHDKISSHLVRKSIELVIEHNKSKFFHFPWLGESRDAKRYSKKDLYRWERMVYENLLRMEESYIKNIWQESDWDDNSNENWLDSSLWSWIWFSS